jgi:hypothetical protein
MNADRRPAERAVVPAAQLYAILDREFRALRPAVCTQCRVPLPFRHAAPDEVSANWLIGTPTECEHGCHLIIAELLATLWTRYDLGR